MQLLEANVRDSGLSHLCSVQELPWGEGSWDKSLPAFDAVIAADVVYREDSAALLAETIACAIPGGSQAPFLLGEALLLLLLLLLLLQLGDAAATERTAAAADNLRRFYQPSYRCRCVL